MLMIPLRIFGCVAFVNLHENQHTKLDPCAIRGLFSGYGSHIKGYRCHYLVTKHTYVTIDVTFLESDTFSKAINSPRQGENLEEVPNWF